MKATPETGTRAPSLAFPAQADLRWDSSADMIRFRANSRPRELLEQPVVVRRFGKRQVVLITDPAAADTILHRRADAFPMAAAQQRLGYAVFGPGLRGTVGEQNRRQRRAMAPLMTARQSLTMAKIARAATIEAVQRWLSQGTVDLAYEMAELALQITWAGLLGPGRYGGRDPHVCSTMQRLYEHPKADVIGATNIVRNLSDRLATNGRWQCLPEAHPLRAIGCPQVSARHGMSQEELRANALVLTLAGHVTTGLTLAWAGWFLSQDMLVQSRAREAVNNNSAQTFLDQVLNETLRLLPPVPELMRDARESLNVAGIEIEPGAIVIVSIYGLHRHRRLWNDPDIFRPERFGTSSLEPFAPGAFIPFSAGKFGCTGASLARSEMREVFKMLLQSAQLEIDSLQSANVGLSIGACIYPDQPLHVRIRPR